MQSRRGKFKEENKGTNGMDPGTLFVLKNPDLEAALPILGIWDAPV